MNTLRVLYHMARADFLERVRSYRFLVMLLFTIFATYIFIPAPKSVQIAGLQLGGYRSIYNSAWIGSMTTLLMGEFFLLFAFYLLKGRIEQDRVSGVGQIIATTPITKNIYIMGKWASNMVVVTAMVVVIIAACIALQYIRGEDYSLKLWAITSPFVLVLLPALTIVAVVAVLFDSINWLRGALGNVIFFFIAYPALTLALDLAGNNIIYPSIYRACAEQFFNCNPIRQIDAGMPPLLGLPIFPYHGVSWTMDIITGRLALMPIGILIALLASWLFHRFDPAESETTLPKIFLWQNKTTPAIKLVTSMADETTPVFISNQRTLTPITSRANSSLSKIYWQLLKQEIKLTFKGVSWLWYLIAFGLITLSLLLSLDSTILVILPMGWVLPLPLWSVMGAREARHGVEQIIFSTPHHLQKQLPIAWLVGVLIALVMGSGIILRLMFAGQWNTLLAMLIGAMFVPTLALAMGIGSRGSKLFEGTYLFVWYLSSIAGVQILDYMGRLPNSFDDGIQWFYAGVTLVLMMACLIGRKRQISHSS